MTTDQTAPADVTESTDGTELPTETAAAETPADSAADPAADSAAESAAIMSDGTPVGVLELEALLFVAERPLTRREIGTLCGLDREAVDSLLGDLEVALEGRGIRLVSVDDRVELVTAPEAGALIARYVGGDGGRLSAASLETLAIVAYRQPVTRGVIERIRGVDSDYVVRSLLHKRLVVEQGRADSPGRPILYGTGFEFMERFGLTSLEELPQLDAEVAARLVIPDDTADEEPTADDKVADGEEPGDEAGATDG